jgi:cob(I)alamin adenosyltransferase
VPRIYTRAGDEGKTGLVDGTRVSKADPRVAAYGDVDELNAFLGLVRARKPDADLDSLLERLQRDLFALGARLADPRQAPSGPAKAALGPDDVKRLEDAIDRLEGDLPALRRFILPGGSETGALLHLARTVCRRAERRIVALGDAADALAIVYINRLSDLLFVMARTVNRRAGAGETEW